MPRSANPRLTAIFRLSLRSYSYAVRVPPCSSATSHRNHWGQGARRRCGPRLENLELIAQKLRRRERAGENQLHSPVHEVSLCARGRVTRAPRTFPTTARTRHEVGKPQVINPGLRRRSFLRDEGFADSLTQIPRSHKYSEIWRPRPGARARTTPPTPRSPELMLGPGRLKIDLQVLPVGGPDPRAATVPGRLCQALEHRDSRGQAGSWAGAAPRNGASLPPWGCPPEENRPGLSPPRAPATTFRRARLAMARAGRLQAKGKLLVFLITLERRGLKPHVITHGLGEFAVRRR